MQKCNAYQRRIGWAQGSDVTNLLINHGLAKQFKIVGLLPLAAWLLFGGTDIHTPMHSL